MERFFPENRVRYISILDGIDTGVDSSANDITPFRAAKFLNNKIAMIVESSSFIESLDASISAMEKSNGSISVWKNIDIINFPKMLDYSEPYYNMSYAQVILHSF